MHVHVKPSYYTYVTQVPVPCHNAAQFLTAQFSEILWLKHQNWCINVEKHVTDPKGKLIVNKKGSEFVFLFIL